VANRRTAELRALDTTDLEQELIDAQNDLMGLRFGLATRKTENTARLGQVKRQIARIKTILTERMMEEE
jgi:large subunit ribosomal protein L29